MTAPTRSVRRRSLVLSLCLVAVVAAGGGTWAVVDGASSAAGGSSDRAGERSGTTAVITKGDLTDTKTFAGKLGFGTASGVPGTAPGTLTWLPRPGDTIRRDQPVYAVDERPVRAMYGTVPMWRELARRTKGTDVRQLNENLAALGYDVAVDDVFGPRTQRAVERWQRDRDLRVTGALTNADLVFVDGEVRVASVVGVLGRPADGNVITVTSTEQVVTVTVSQREAERLAVGTEVEILVNGVGGPMHGKVADVAPDGDAGGGDGSDAGGGGGGDTIVVSVSFDAGDRKVPTAGAAQIEAKGTTVKDVLSVPVSALVAGKDGKYAVDVVRRDGTTARTTVVPGFTAGGRIAVTGSVSEGDRVVVPA